MLCAGRNLPPPSGAGEAHGETLQQSAVADMSGCLHDAWPNLDVGLRVRDRGQTGLPIVKIFLRSALNGDVGPLRLALGLVAHRVDHGDPRGGRCDDGFRGDEGTGPTGSLDLSLSNLVAILICVIAVIGLLLAVLYE
jgi:hypothetical protein